jgi:predicted Zn-dependent protease
VTAYPVVPGAPAAGHIAGGFWHPGQADGCVKCTPYTGMAPVARYGPEKVAVGDTVTWKGGSGTVTFAGQHGCYAETGDSEHRLPWRMITGHTRRRGE